MKIYTGIYMLQAGHVSWLCTATYSHPVQICHTDHTHIISELAIVRVFFTNKHLKLCPLQERNEALKRSISKPACTKEERND